MSAITSSDLGTANASIAFAMSSATFEVCNQVEKLLEANGFAVGALQRNEPRGVMFNGDGHCWLVAKWDCLTQAERNALHGVVTGDTRNGPLAFTLLPAAPPAAIAAFETMRGEGA